MEKLKLGSLFDGIGGFPFAAMQWEIEPVWASEIEPFPIKVTEHHFPDMKHLGDITQINGAEIEPVDIITFGSPCQDLSVAGKREGLAGARSGLFMDAVRIIRGMRTATGGKYPRFAVWENVPGAFSSNGGEDFRAVIEEIAETEIPMPTSGKWAEAGMVRTERVDIAWRVLDAQYWGVPQRRKRIFLVADFTGQCAGEILFKPEGLRRNFAESGEAREEAAGNVGDGIEESNCLTPWDVQSRRIHDVNGKWPSLYGGEGGGHGYVAQCVTNGTGRRYDPETETFVVEPRSQDGVCGIHHDGIVPTFNTAQGGQRQPCVCIQNATRGKSQNGLGVSQDDVSYTLDSLGNHAVAYPDPANTLLVKANLSFRGDADTVVAVDCRNLCENKELSGTLQSKDNGGYSLNYQNPVRIGYAVRRLTPLECERLQGFPDNWTNIPGASDTARYKAIGNSVAIPCVSFILRRISEVLRRV